MGGGKFYILLFENLFLFVMVLGFIVLYIVYELFIFLL